MRSSIFLHRIVDLRIPVAWHEAVAVAEAASAQAKKTGQDVGIETCAITETGEVQLFGIPVRPLTEPAQGILRALLNQKEAPAALVALSVDAAATAFDEKLHFFARPDPVAEIQALAVRAIAMEMDIAAKSVIEEIRSEVATVPEKRPSSRKVSRKMLIVAGAAVFAVAIAIGAWTRPSVRADAIDPATNAEAADTASQPETVPSTSSPIALARSAVAAVAELISPSVETPSRGADIVLKTPRVRRSVTPIPPPAAALESSVRDTARAESGQESASAADLLTVEEPIVLDPNIYSNGDAAVDPPALLRPQIPRMLPLPYGAETGPHLTLLVTPEGTVETVRLMGAHTVRDRMLLSAAKAWVFRPALKDGRPVRYWLRVPLPR